jgi:hypothetical protein
MNEAELLEFIQALLLGEWVNKARETASSGGEGREFCV